MSSRGITRKDLQEILTQERQLLMADIDKIVWTAIPRLVPVGVGDGPHDMEFRGEIEALKYCLDQKCSEVASQREQITELSKQLCEMEQQIKTLREQQAAMSARPADDTQIGEVDLKEQEARISWIITEVGHAPCPKLAKKGFNKTEVHEKVMAKINRDRTSPESAIYRRNYCLMMHLTRRKPFSKEAKKTLVDLWKLFGISGDIVAFSGRMFDRDYLNPKSDKFFQYVTYLVFLHKYQRLSQPVTKNSEPCDSNEYFWRHW
jgi:hypothetical protein